MAGRLASIVGIVLVAMLSQSAFAQIKPASSGQPSFNAPEMRKHGSGLYRPNKPHKHRRHRRPRRLSSFR